MKTNILNKIANSIGFTGFPIILMSILISCSNFNPKRLEGWKDLYLINCSDDDVTIETSLKRFEEIFHNTGIDKTYPNDTISSMDKRTQYYQWLFKAKNYEEKGDSLLIFLKPQEGMRIYNLEWLIAPTKFREHNLNVDNLRIITKYDTFIARNRKEILQLRFDRKCTDGVYFITIKYGRHGTPVMYEKVWKGR